MGKDEKSSSSTEHLVPEETIEALAETLRPHVVSADDGTARLPAITSIVLEGGEGCGKGTVQHALVRVLRKAGLDAVGIREPGGSPMGEKIRNVLLDDSGTSLMPMAKAMLFAASRAQLIRDVVEPAIERGQTLIFDRFVQSSYVYQGIVDGIGMECVMELNAMAMDGFSPSISLFLDVSPKVGLSRIENANSTRDVNWLDRKPLEWHERVHSGYMNLVDAGLLTRIDAKQTPEVVLNQCIHTILSKSIANKASR